MRAWSSTVAVGLVAASCSFDPAGVGGRDAFVDPGDDGGGVPRTWRHDSVEDFAVAEARLEQAIVEPWGAIGPAAYLTGGLLARGSNSQLFTNPDGDVWPTLAAATSAGFGVSELAPVDWGFDYPRGVSISNGDTFTYWLEGEVWLGAGEHAWELTVDDVGFLELARPGAAELTRVATARVGSPGQGSLVAAVAGWYPLRVAMAEGLGLASLAVRRQGPGAEAAAPVPPEDLRVRADVLTGLHWSAFDDSRLLEPRGVFLFRQAGFDYAPSNGAVTALGLSSSDTFAMRWAGQVRIDVAGTYLLRLDTDDGHRLWLDGQLLLDHFVDSPQNHLTAPIELDVGWHDLVADLTDNTGGQRIRLRVVAGPELEGEPFPADRLRPVRPRHERAIGAVGGGGLVPDPGELLLEVPIAAPAGAEAVAVEVGVTISHADWRDLEIAVIPPGGAPVTGVAAGSIPRGGAATERRTVAVPASAAAGTWMVRVRDTAAGATGVVERVALTVRARGGAPPIAPRAIYESAVEDLGTVIGFDAVHWTGRFPAGTGVAVRLRTCAEAAACGEAPWSEPVTVSGGAPPVVAGRFAQYQVELTSDGDATPYLDAIEIAYRGAAPD
jgi:hypothetical protein